MKSLASAKLVRTTHLGEYVSSKLGRAEGFAGEMLKGVRGVGCSVRGGLLTTGKPDWNISW